jgi:hypothetical protein
LHFTDNGWHVMGFHWTMPTVSGVLQTDWDKLRYKTPVPNKDLISFNAVLKGKL